MEKINLNLTVSIDTAIKILEIMKNQNEEEEFTEILADTTKDFPDISQEIPKENSQKVVKATLDDVRHAFVELSQTKGKEVAKQVIASLGFKRVTEIPENMFDIALSKVKEAL